MQVLQLKTQNLKLRTGISIDRPSAEAVPYPNAVTAMRKIIFSSALLGTITPTRCTKF
jgi:hypothetical protein